MTESKEEKYLNAMTYVPREHWKAKKAKFRKPIQTPVPYVHFTYSNSVPCENKRECVDRVQTIQTCCMYSCKLPDIKANFLIGGDGRVYEGRGWKYTTDRPSISNRLAPLTGQYIEIAFICRDNEEPTRDMKLAATALVEEGLEKNVLSKNLKVFTIWQDYTIPKGVTEIKNVEVMEAPPL